MRYYLTEIAAKFCLYIHFYHVKQAQKWINRAERIVGVEW